MKRLMYFLSIVYCAGIYILLLFFLNKHIIHLMDGDLSAELVNGWLLHKQGGIILSDWYFSTELRILNIPLVYSILFNFTSSWHTVRMLAYALLLALLAGSAYYLCVSLDAKRYAFLCAAFVLTPFSMVYFKFVLWGLYYIPHISTAFFSLGMILRLQKDYKKLYLNICLTALAFVTCLGGMRLLVQFYVPLIIVFCWYYMYDKKDSIKYLKNILPCCIAGIGGVVINIFVLHRYYSFSEQSGYHFQKFDILAVSDCIANIFEGLGYIEGSFNKWSITNNAACLFLIILTVLAVVYAIKGEKKDRMMLLWALYFLSALVICFGLRVFSDTSMHTRYYLPVVLFIFPGICAYLNKYEFRRVQRSLPLVLLILLMLCSGAYGFIEGKGIDNNDNLEQLVAMLEAKGYQNGYASTEGPTIIEMSDGRLDVWGWDPHDMDNQTDVDRIWPWLQRISHSWEKPEGRIFVCLSLNKYQECPMCKYWTGHIIYEDSVRVIFGFESYEELKHLSSGGDEI